MFALIPSPNPYAVSVSESWMSFSSGNVVYVYLNYELAATLEFDFKPMLTAVHVSTDKWVYTLANHSSQSVAIKCFSFILPKTMVRHGILCIQHILKKNR